MIFCELYGKKIPSEKLQGLLKKEKGWKDGIVDNRYLTVSIITCIISAKITGDGINGFLGNGEKRNQ